MHHEDDNTTIATAYNCVSIEEVVNAIDRRFYLALMITISYCTFGVLLERNGSLAARHTPLLLNIKWRVALSISLMENDIQYGSDYTNSVLNVNDYSHTLVILSCNSTKLRLNSHRIHKNINIYH